MDVESTPEHLAGWLIEIDGSVRAVLALGGVPVGDLDDGVQHVRLAVLEESEKPSWGAISSHRAWVHTVASNVAVTWHRRRTRDRRLHDRLAREWSVRASSRDPDRDLALVVARGLDGLSRLHRQVLVLRFYADLPVAEIATRLGVAEGTVKSRLHHATRAMSRVLDEDGVV